MNTLEPVQPVLEVDVTKLNRLQKWLTGFFVTGLGSFIALLVVPKGEIEIQPLVHTLFAAIVIGWWGYIIILGRMAIALHKSALTWSGLTIIFNLFGFIGSFIMMHNRVQDARQTAVTRND